MANNCETVKTTGNEFVKNETDHNNETEKENLKEKKALKEQYTENDRSNIAEVYDKEGDLKKQNDDLKDKLEEAKKTLIENYEKSMSSLRDQLELRMKVEIHEIEERKN